MPQHITIKELHATTGAQVRRAGRARAPVVITDRGEPVAVLANPALLQPKRRPRALLPAFKSLMARKPGPAVAADLAAVRGDR